VFVGTGVSMFANTLTAAFAAGCARVVMDGFAYAGRASASPAAVIKDRSA